ncbi:hypothetical protein LU298_15985 [Komagataeibacter intermedius]|uniref:Uncharacterized protein n=2 Tax=Komagataeibacter intermedius TaxID=66229 RepID=A0A0N1FLT9_9PROT|nr:hypothetical protein [Komagataeibacter intermedius]KPH85349.1 hypothetical protein GLUCOINTEAF2_0201236 [Komagataeibacter intermedius AF2]MCF3637974.1 hypothetical protein [Komagataeibacter intermedius]GAN88682.1 hypothetical protein Gain_0417_007 [Komagataeibacter intermedius TF2]GBQ74899.1 hypothetical protein AA0521_2568 [Komagataeibacter intermedius NRIC 0521]
MEDEDGIVTERNVLLGEIRSDLERLSNTMDDTQTITDEIRSTIAMLGDKLDALSDLMRR